MLALMLGFTTASMLMADPANGVVIEPPRMGMAPWRPTLLAIVSPRFQYWLDVRYGLVPTISTSGECALIVLPDSTTFCSCTPGNWPCREANQSPPKSFQVSLMMRMLSCAASWGLP